jgi:hypothetical protein
VELRVVGADPPAPCLPKESAAGGATKIVPTSECRRRPKGTGVRTSVATPPAAPRTERIATHSPSKPEPQSHPWFRGMHTRPGHPSIVSVTARSRPWDFPSPRARTPPDAIPTRLARAAWPFYVSPWLENTSKARAPSLACSPHRPARQTLGMRFFQARSRVSVMRLVAPMGVATGDASDRLLHSETVPTRALVLRRFPAQRQSRAMPYGAVRVPLSFRSLSVPCSFARTSLFARRFVSPKTREASTGRLGAFRCKRGRGESRFTAQLPLQRPDDVHSVAFSAAARNRCRPPLAPLSPPPCRRLVSLFFESQTVARRPPRPVPRGPRERRALHRSRVPSAGRCWHASRSRRSTNETAQPSTKTRRSRDEDRRASLIRPPFAADGLLRLRA